MLVLNEQVKLARHAIFNAKTKISIKKDNKIEEETHCDKRF